MPRMIDLIRQSAVPANIMRSAASGALSLPPSEMVEILVHLSKHHVWGQQAQLTLAGWDNASLEQIAAEPNSPLDVVDYLSAPANLRPALLPALLENPAVSEERLIQIAATANQDQVQTLLASPRVCMSARSLRALSSNASLAEEQVMRVQELLASCASEDEKSGSDSVLDLELSDYLREHADEIRDAESQPFSLFGWTTEEQVEAAAAPAPSGVTSTVAATTIMAAAARAERERISPIRKIAAMSVGERVQLALKGSKDERFILIRDGARVVCNAVLESPKLTDSEVELFASMKNVNESVLRGIAAKRKFMKNYAVIRILTMNPRCPIEVALPLLAHLLTVDLRHLSANKNVSDTVRKMAWKIYRERISNRNH